MPIPGTMLPQPRIFNAPVGLWFPIWISNSAALSNVNSDKLKLYATAPQTYSTQIVSCLSLVHQVLQTRILVRLASIAASARHKSLQPEA